MISIGTNLKVVDNSGAKVVQCIKVLGGTFIKHGYVGDVIIVSVIKALPFKKVKKGDVQRAVIVSTKKSLMRSNGVAVSFGDNCVVLVNNKNLPLGTRIISPVMLELRAKKFLKVLSLAVVAI